MMKKNELNVSLLKANASSALRSIREEGVSFLIFDRDIPVARMVPYTRPDVIIQKAKRKFHVPKNSVKVIKSPLEFLLEDRRKS